MAANPGTPFPSFSTISFSTISYSRTVEAGIDQTSDELIYSIVRCPTWTPVEYKAGGLYDRVLESFKLHREDEELTEQEEYQWVRIPAPSNLNSVYLARPGKTPERKDGRKFRGDRFTYYSYWTNVVRLDLFFYNSATHKTIQAFTFGDRKKVIKPIKILKHKWKLLRSDTNQWDGSTPMYSGKTNWKCDECGLLGTSKHNNGKAIVPNQMLTCEEAVVQDILV